MADLRKRQLMQESLDGELTPDRERELNTYLNEAPEEAHHYNSLQLIDTLLRTAKHERAPERLALTIMARLAQQVQKQEVATHDALSEAAVQVAFQMVTVATLPLMVGMSYMLLNAMSSPAYTEAVLQQVVGLHILMIDVMKVFIEQAEEIGDDDPEAAMALLMLMPATLLALVKQVLGIEDDEDEAEN